MKIGDKVRFLNEVGGGVVAGFPDKQTVLVRDEDGFEIPVLIRECVVVETDSYNLPLSRHGGDGNAPDTGQRPADNRFRTRQPDTFVHSFDDDEDDKPITFRPKPLERRGADVLNIFIGFVPVDVKMLASTAIEAFVVNDSNYYLYYVLLTHEGAACATRHEGVVEPNAKVFLEEFQRDVLGEWERITFQAIAYKKDKSFRPKEPVNVSLRPDVTKFYKLHTFTETDFFELPAYLLPVVRDDQPARSVYASAEELKEAILSKPSQQQQNPQPQKHGKTASRKKGDELVEVDLHASELLDTTVGLTSQDILAYQLKVFRETMQKYASHPGQRIVFIHGKGEGVLRNAIIDELRRNYKSCAYQDASFREYGFGATMVTVWKKVPTR